MNRNVFSRSAVMVLFIALAVALTGGYSALAQNSGLTLWVSKVRQDYIKLRWDPVGSNTLYVVRFRRANSPSSDLAFAGDTYGNSFVLSGLRRGTEYIIEVDGGFYVGRVTVSTLPTE